MLSVFLLSKDDLKIASMSITVTYVANISHCGQFCSDIQRIRKLLPFILVCFLFFRMDLSMFYFACRVFPLQV